jgi:hypothetical protein
MCRQVQSKVFQLEQQKLPPLPKDYTRTHSIEVKGELGQTCSDLSKFVVRSQLLTPGRVHPHRVVGNLSQDIAQVTHAFGLRFSVNSWRMHIANFLL